MQYTSCNHALSCFVSLCYVSLCEFRLSPMAIVMMQPLECRFAGPFVLPLVGKNDPAARHVLGIALDGLFSIYRKGAKHNVIYQHGSMDSVESDWLLNLCPPSTCLSTDSRTGSFGRLDRRCGRRVIEAAPNSMSPLRPRGSHGSVCQY